MSETTIASMHGPTKTTKKLIEHTMAAARIISGEMSRLELFLNDSGMWTVKIGSFGSSASSLDSALASVLATLANTIDERMVALEKARDTLLME